MRIGIWNIGGALTHGVNDKAWPVLWDHDQFGVDIALVQEAYLPPEAGRVVGQPFNEDGVTSSRWGTYVVARPNGPTLTAIGRSPVGDTGPDAVEDSYPGTTAIACLDVDGLAVYLVSVYGALVGIPTRHAETTMHRVLSDLTDLIASGKPVLIAGDFNVTTQPYASADPGGWWHRQDQTVFDRLTALGMVDLVDSFLPGDYEGLPRCPCGGIGCRHVRTTRHRHHLDSTPYQNDWAFGTEAMANLVTSCAVVDDEACWAVSDHAPIVVALS